MMVGSDDISTHVVVRGGKYGGMYLDQFFSCLLGDHIYARNLTVDK